MKVKAIIILAIGVILFSLLCASVYDFYKPDSFRAKIDEAKEKLKDEDYSVSFFSGRPYKNLNFMSSITNKKQSGKLFTQISTEVYVNDSLVSKIENKLMERASFRDTAFSVTQYGDILLYGCKDVKKESSAGKRYFIVYKDIHKSWMLMELTNVEIEKYAELKNTIKNW